LRKRDEQGKAQGQEKDAAGGDDLYHLADPLVAGSDDDGAGTFLGNLCIANFFNAIRQDEVMGIAFWRLLVNL